MPSTRATSTSTTFSLPLLLAARSGSSADGALCHDIQIGCPYICSPPPPMQRQLVLAVFPLSMSWHKSAITTTSSSGGPTRSKKILLFKEDSSSTAAVVNVVVVVIASRLEACTHTAVDQEKQQQQRQTWQMHRRN